MKISKKFLQKIIKEEISNAIGKLKKLKRGSKNKKLDSFRRDTINLFQKYRDTITKMNLSDKDEVKKQFKKELNLLKKDYPLISRGVSDKDFMLLCIDKIKDSTTPQLISFSRDILDSDQFYPDKLDSYNYSISPEEEKNRQEYRANAHDPYFLRNPKLSRYETDNEGSNSIGDVRKFRKN